jgi:hypothetical protein
MRLARVRWLRHAKLLIPLVLSAPLAGQQSCPQGVVSVIFIDNHSIFDADDLAEDRPFRWGYRLANSVHMRTRASFVRSELLFDEGDCYDPTLLEESERLLRNYAFIARVDVFGLQQSDGSWHVVVDTKDEWTTKVNLRVAVDQGLDFRGASFAEENFLGRGIRVGVFLRERRDVRDLGAEVYTPRLLGSRVDARVSAGRTRIGRFLEQGFAYPFVGEVGRLAGRQIYMEREELFPYSLGVLHPAEGEITHLLLPTDEGRFELTMAARIGTPGNLTTFGLGFSNATLDYPGFPDAMEVARAGNFDDRELAPPATALLVEPQTLLAASARLNLLVGQRNLRFEQRSGLDAITGVQDVAVGSDVGVTIGRSAAALSSRDDQPDDLYARLRGYVGRSREQVVLGSAFAVEGRQVFGGGEGGEGWKDLLGEVDVVLYLKPTALPAHTVFFRLEGAGGWEMERPFQLTLGGEAEVRGYTEDAFPASQRLILTLEDRINFAWPAPDLLDLGVTVFADAGRGWAGEVPFGVDSGWRGTVGAGLRLGFPAGTQGVMRLDFAFPVGPGTDPRDMILRASLGELLGLLAGFESRQIGRSRRNNIGLDLFSGG